jgi:hypothetical protein
VWRTSVQSLRAERWRSVDQLRRPHHEGSEYWIGGRSRVVEVSVSSAGWSDRPALARCGWRAGGLAQRRLDLADEDWAAGSGGPLVFVDDAAEDVAADDTAPGGGRRGARDRLLKSESAVGSGLVVVADVLGEHHLDMSA